MGEIVGELLPIALGVAISPVPIIAVILMLLAPHAKAASLAFVAGWVVGIGVVVTVVTLVVDPVDDSEAGDPSTAVSIVKIALGAAALVLAGRNWRSRPGEGEQPQMPTWMGAIDTITASKALGLGVLLAAVNPKNLTLGLNGGVAIGSGALTTGETAAAIVIFVVIGSCTVAIPVIGYLVAQRRMQQPLDELRQWLTVHNTAVMAVVLLVLGFSTVGKGIAGLWPSP